MTATKEIIFDATNQSLGRLASRIAMVVRGKHRPSFQPGATPTVKVFVKNCSRLKVTPKKLDQKLFHRTSGFPGAVKTTSMRQMFERDPRSLLLRALRGMLPANKHRTLILKNVRLEN